MSIQAVLICAALVAALFTGMIAGACCVLRWMKSRECEALVEFRPETREQWEALYKAESHLADAGVRFDKGGGLGARDWEMDWSLRGARVFFKRAKGRNAATPCGDACRAQRFVRLHLQIARGLIALHDILFYRHTR